MSCGANQLKTAKNSAVIPQQLQSSGQDFQREQTKMGLN